MSAAILSCGPSLAATYDDETDYDRYDVVIGVNYVVETHRCDWWCFGDLNQAVKKPLIDPYGICYAKDIDMQLRREGRIYLADQLMAHRVLFWREIHHRGPGGYTALIALYLAALLGRGTVDVFGHDMKGSKDYKGDDGPSYRSQVRWILETSYWDQAVEIAKSMGLEVNRIRILGGTDEETKLERAEQSGAQLGRAPRLSIASHVLAFQGE